MDANFSRRLRKTSMVGVLMALLTVGTVVPVFAQAACLEWIPPMLLNTSNFGDNGGATERSLALDTITWGNKHLLFSNTGNNLHVWNISDPHDPHDVTLGKFNVPSFGDRDFNAFALSICDDCRYGILGYAEQGVVLFDMGTGTNPILTTYLRYYEVVSYGFATFKWGGKQYMLAPGFGANCGLAGSGSALYELNGIRENERTVIECVDQGSTRGQFVKAYTVLGADGTYLYLFDAPGSTGDKGSIYKVTSGGTGPHLTYLGTPFEAYTSRKRGVRIDHANSMMAVAQGKEVRIWDIAVPDQPALLHEWQPKYPIVFNTVDIQYPFLTTAQTGASQPIKVYNISVPTNPEELDPDFWDPDKSWNSYNWENSFDFEFGNDGTTFFFARKSILQAVDAADCGPNSPPVADVMISPQPAYPGDENPKVTVANAAVGVWTRSALWIEDDGGQVVLGSTQLSSQTPDELEFVIPATIPSWRRYFAKVAVESDAWPFNPQAPGDQLKTREITIDRADLVQIDIPASVLLGDQVQLNATTNGPWDMLVWTVTPPDGVPVEYILEDPEQVPPTITFNNASDTWSVAVRADFLHEQEGGGANYSTSASTTVNVKSVVASFFVDPSSPKTTDSIILDASATRPTTNVDYRWTITGATNYSQCGNTKACVIPAGTLNPGSHTVELEATNSTDGKKDTVNTGVYVADGTINLDFTATPSSPNIGQRLSFEITGVSGTLQQATWNFGGPPCSPTYSQNYTCNPTFISCNITDYDYSTAGTKNVWLTVKVDGTTYGPVGKTVTVQNSGTCGSSCTYSVSPTSKSVLAAGGSGSFSVVTNSGCTWSASPSESWVNITSGSSGNGSGTVSYTVTANTGAARSAWIVVEGRYHTIDQAAAGTTAVDFSISNETPEVGESVMLTVLGSSIPVRWDFGGTDCDGSSQILNCPAGFEYLCKEVTWSWAEPGVKTIAYTSEEGVKQKTITVQSGGSCPQDCEADGPPQADFTIDPNPAEVGQEVTFSYTEGAAARNPIRVEAQTLAAGDFSWNPASPEIGQQVGFTLDGYGGTITQATWSFGGTPCGTQYQQSYVCTPSTFNDCKRAVYAYADSGAKSVSVQVTGSSGTANGSDTVTVQNSGTCGGGTPACSWSISPTARSIGAAGATGSVSVSTTAGCDWTAISNNTSWLHLTGSTAGSSSGSVSYTADANSGGARIGTLRVAGKTFTLNQAAADPGGTGGGDAATDWQWTVKLDNQTVATSTQSSFNYAFEHPGTYIVSLIASNCAGSDSLSREFTVYEIIQPSTYVVPAAAHSTGQGDTTWRTDLRLYNPGSEEFDVKLEFLPEAKDNTGPVPFLEFSLPSRGTKVIDDVLPRLPGLGSGDSKGALRFSYDGGDGMAPVIMSRTYNDTDYGTYGQYVPAVPVMPVEGDKLFLTGLVQNAFYRTNVGLANLTDTTALAVKVCVMDEAGQDLGSYTLGIPANSSVQVVNAARAAGVTKDLDSFSVRVETNGAQLFTYGSVVDDSTGDSVLYTPSPMAQAAVYLPGVAQIQGAFDTDRNTDITFLNTTDQSLNAVVTYVPETPLDFEYGWLQPLGPGMSFSFERVLEWLTNEPDLNTKGYFKIAPSEPGGLVPLVASRTYNLTDDGTYGQTLAAFSIDHLIAEGNRASIPGVENNIDFRTNLGLVNTSDTDEAKVDIVVYDGFGDEIARIPDYPLAPEQFVQFNLFAAVDMGTLPVTASVEIEVNEGGPVAAYASVIDNRTQDPIEIPAIVLPEMPQ